MKIHLGMIVRNEGQTLAACLDSVAEIVDTLTVGFAGESTDNTEQIVAAFAGSHSGITVETLHIDWEDNFAAARNRVLDAVVKIAAPEDLLLWIDGDDEIIAPDYLRKAASEHPDVNCFWVGYDYAKGENGETTCFLIRERLVRNPAQWRWEGRVHEVLTLSPDVPLVQHHVEETVVVHQRNDKDKGTRNLDLLYKELEATEPKPAQRTLMYLGNENASRGNTAEALRFWNRFISQAEWSEESYQVAHKIADLLRSQGRLDEAEAADLRAIRLAPHWPDAYFGLAQTAYERKEWQAVIEWTKAGATKPPPVTGLIVNPLDYNHLPYYVLGLAYAQLGNHAEALLNLRLAAAVRPEHDLMGTIMALETEVGAQQVLGAFMALYAHLARNDEWLKARRLFELAPKTIEQHPDVREAWYRTNLSTAHVVDPQVMVDFYRGNPNWQPMDEKTVFSAGWRDHPRMAFARKALCEPPKWILDVGSSDGFISLPLAKDGYKVFGLDLDPRVVEVANERATRLKLSAVYTEGSIDDLDEDDRYDAAIAFEIIEHLVSPGDFLDKLDKHVNKVILTTPFLAWEGGRVSDAQWQKVEPKSHLRIFDLVDMEILLGGRGQIVDLYREPWGSTGWIFASYYPGRSATKTATFLAPATLEEWSPRKLKEQGLGGSETALIKLAEQMATGGYLCTTYGRIDNPGYYNGVRYRSAEHFLPAVSQDIFVAWRYPEAADLPLPDGAKLVLWAHDTDYGDRLTPVRAARFERIVVLTEWHRTHLLRVYPWLTEAKVVVIGNGVDTDLFDKVRKEDIAREPHRVVYTSSPDRGLDVILEYIWPKVVEKVPDAELHVYYGWNNFEALKTAYPHLAEFQQKVALLMLQTKNVVMHGRVPQDQLARELAKATVWLYPTYFAETFCISAVEAQLAGVIPVTNALAALAETVRSGFQMDYDPKQAEKPEIMQRYADAVIGYLTDQDAERNDSCRDAIKNAPAQSWEDVMVEWIDLVL